MTFADKLQKLRKAKRLSPKRYKRKNTMKKINKKKYLCMLPMLENGYKFF